MSPRGATGWVMVCCGLLLAEAADAAGRPVTLTAADGVTISGEFYEASATPAPAVVLVHMLGRSRADWEDMATTLAAAGVTALAIDVRGHGASGGSVRPLTDAVQDVRAALQWLSQRSGVRPDALGLVGVSMGASLAVLAALDQPLARVVATVSLTLDYQGLRLSAEAFKALGGRAIWMAASRGDPYAARTVAELSKDALVPVEQVMSDEPAHGSLLLRADPEVARALVDWLRVRLLS
jgi:alpha-beta hydrolase superfamily lysophospholipase